jgi:hypothetical protein
MASFHYIYENPRVSGIGTVVERRVARSYLHITENERFVCTSRGIALYV